MIRNHHVAAAAAAQEAAADAVARRDRAREDEVLGRTADWIQNGACMAIDELELAAGPLGVERG